MTASEITQIRVSLGLSKAAFARKIGVTERAIYYWEDGERRPNLDDYLRLKEVAQEAQNA